MTKKKYTSYSIISLFLLAAIGVTVFATQQSQVTKADVSAISSTAVQTSANQSLYTENPDEY